MTKTKQRYKNPDNIEKVYIQLRFPDYSQLNKIKIGKKIIHCGCSMEISKLAQLKNLWSKKKIKNQFLFKKVIYQIS